MRTGSRILAVVLCAGAAASAALAQPGDMPGHPPPMMMDSGAGRVLGLLLRPDTLTDDQRQQIDAIMAADRTTVHDTLDKLRAANESLAAALLAASAPTADSLTPLTDQISALRDSLVAQQVQTALAVRAVLTAEQIAAAEAQREQFAAQGDPPFPMHP